MNDKQQFIKSSFQQKKIEQPILVVDDDHNLRQTIRCMLEEEKFAVRTAADGQEAVEQALAQQPSLIILDMGLPLLDGSQVSAQVRSHYGEAVPIVLITADGQAEEKSRLVGATAFLRKPFDIDDLIDVVQYALKPEK